jgi:hypothetical protein
MQIDQEEKAETLARAVITSAHNIQISIGEMNRALYHLCRALDKDKPPMRRPPRGGTDRIDGKR